jgi:chromosome segregation and condensation protein ScpB
VLQSDIIDIRSTKAYDHIEELVTVGFITKARYGRSFMLRLSQQFFEYFDIKNKEQVKEIFKDVAVEAKPREQKELSEVIPKEEPKEKSADSLEKDSKM